MTVRRKSMNISKLVVNYICLALEEMEARLNSFVLSIMEGFKEGMF